MNNPRKAAVQALEKFRRNGAWIDSLSESIGQKENLDKTNFSLFVYLATGTISNLLFLDAVIQKFSSRPVRSIEPKLLDIIRISVFQLYFCDKIPPFAAVNEAVDLCRSCGFTKATGFTNAILRNMIRQKCPYPDQTGIAEDDLSVRYSHSKDIVRSVISLLGQQETEEFLRKNNEIPDIYIQANLQKNTPELLFEIFTENNIPAVPHSRFSNCFCIRPNYDFSQSSEFNNGRFFIQDPAAYETVRMGIESFVRENSSQKSIKILDLCAAPGGKSMAAASILGESCTILACDIHSNKLKRIQDNARRLGFLQQIETKVNDALVMNEEFYRAYDIVIADVPCSGFGVIRKKPEIRYKEDKDIKELPSKQLAILRNAAQYVRNGGLLIYSTCTVTSEENEGVISQLDEMIPYPIKENKNIIRFWPQRDETDGFFAAYFKRAE